MDARLSVRVDGRQIERFDAKALPLLDGLEAGARSLEVRHPDYEAWQQSVTIRDQQTTAVDVKLAPKPATLTLKVSGPAEYTLLAGGKPVALANHRATLPGVETHALEIAAKGYKSVARRLALPANGTHTWEVALEKLRGPEPGQPWTIPDMGLVLQPIAAGTFAMGSPETESGRSGDEGPVTRVTLTKAFWLGKTEVTQREWTAVMGSNPSHFKGGDRPVENVSWDDAVAFCRKLTERERAAGRIPAGFAYTLSTEAQWEYACRAGTTGPFAGASLDALGWYDANSGKETKPVRQKQANAWGLHDMHGNVWEWCADWYADKLPGGSVRDPSGPNSGSNRVNRGGSWGIFASVCRSAIRDGTVPGNRLLNLGFRLALAPQVSQ